MHDRCEQAIPITELAAAIAAAPEGLDDEEMWGGSTISFRLTIAADGKVKTIALDRGLGPDRSVTRGGPAGCTVLPCRHHAA